MGGVDLACTVVVADDNELFRSGLVHGLRSHGFEVLAEADSGPTAVAAVLSTAPDAVLMDLWMPGYGGVDATRRILEQLPDAQVIALTVDGTLGVILDALAAGMAGYLLKDAPMREVADAVIAVVRGEAALSPQVAHGLVSHVRRTHKPSRTAAPRLTDRELDVLALLSDGCSNAQIAELLVISPHTVKSHISRVLEKLECGNRVQAVIRAHREGLLRPETGAR